MSFSLTMEKTKDSTQSIVYLSPSKRRRPSTPPIEIGSSIKEIYNWILIKPPEAIAICSVRDALQMRANESQGYEFFWLGGVPCRTVKIIGLTVGIQIYEKRIIYSIDDGTGVIDCSHQHQRTATTSKRSLEPLPDLKPITRIGKFVEVVGIVRSHHDSRVIGVDEIACTAPNEELLHAREVRRLHKVLYSNKEPFVIPAPKNPQTPRKNHAPPTPSTWQSSLPSSVSSSPLKQVHELEQVYKSPIKLRHPSRLHTHDLTDNTFRIYLKHYMDHSPDLIPDEDYDSDVGGSIAQIPTTPTKRSHIDATPRSNSSYRNLDSTPRPHIRPLDFGIGTTSRPESSCTLRPPSTTRKGFTLSHLRRVPELSLLASRVANAVIKRRLRTEKQKLKDAGTKPTSSQKAQLLAAMVVSPAQIGRKIKRLFQWAIVQLLKEGCLVHWEGPVRACPESTVGNASLLWKTIGDGSSLFSMSSSCSSSMFVDVDVDEGALSDPDPNEEAYISLTPDYLAEFVEKTIKVLVDHNEKIGKPYAGATKDDILNFLRKDDRWKYVGEWTVDDALEMLRKRGKAWNMGKGRWDLTE